MELEELERLFNACVAAEILFKKAEKSYKSAKQQHNEARGKILRALMPVRREKEFRAAMQLEKERHQKLTDAEVSLNLHRKELEVRKNMLWAAIKKEADQVFH